MQMKKKTLLGRAPVPVSMFYKTRTQSHIQHPTLNYNASLEPVDWLFIYYKSSNKITLKDLKNVAIYQAPYCTN